MSITVQDAAVGAFVFGSIADLSLNYITRFDAFPDVGLRKYFKRHGVFEAMFIAGGLMFASTYIGLLLRPGNPTRDGGVLYLFVYGALIDILFREWHLMPTLDGMYDVLRPSTSMLWAGGPLAASYMITKYIKNTL